MDNNFDWSINKNWIDPITSFRGEYAFLSNFFPCKVKVFGYTFISAEHAYQSCKSTDTLWLNKCTSSEHTPAEIKRASRTIKLVDNWEDIKVSIMGEVLEAKFKQNKNLRDKLIALENRTIVEGNAWNDTFWGVKIETGEGKNMLGQLLMELRVKLTKIRINEALAYADTLGKELETKFPYKLEKLIILQNLIVKEIANVSDDKELKNISSLFIEVIRMFSAVGMRMDGIPVDYADMPSSLICNGKDVLIFVDSIDKLSGQHAEELNEKIRHVAKLLKNREKKENQNIPEDLLKEDDIKDIDFQQLVIKSTKPSGSC